MSLALPPWRGLALGLLALLCCTDTFGHGLNVVQVELRVLDEGRYHLSVRFPSFATTPERFALLPDGCQPLSPGGPGNGSRLELDGDFRCGHPDLPEVSFPWPNSTALAILRQPDGRAFETFIGSGPEGMTIHFGDLDQARGGRAGQARFYGWMGMEHILGGWDHLLFVTCLLFLVQGWRRLALTVTAFTVAHSLTLALAVLDLVRVPSAPVELIIALSVVYLASDILRPGDADRSVARRAPYLIAFGFGLLHGLGFAGALLDVGVPESQVPLALLWFNLGVEAGQLAFAAFLVVAFRFLERLGPSVASHARSITVAMAGCIAAYWVMERGHGLLSGIT